MYTSPTTRLVVASLLTEEFRLYKDTRPKSKILPLSISPNPILTHCSPFIVAKSHITYLGIKIGKFPSSLYTFNYPSLIKRIVQELENWMDLGGGVDYAWRKQRASMLCSWQEPGERSAMSCRLYQKIIA